jgi:septal ring factor EnvC (AmiA/AmiB activator)
MFGLRHLRHLLIAACIGTVSVVALGDASDSARVRQESRKLQAIRDQIQRIQSELARREDERDSLLPEMRTAETELNRVSRKLHGLNRNTAEAKQALAGLNTERTALQNRLARNRGLLAGQLRAAFMAGGQERVKLLLNQQDPAALARVARYYEYLNSARLELMESTRRTLAGLSAVEAGIQDNKKALQALKLQYDSEHQRWSQLRRERQKLLSRIESEIKQGADSIGRLRADQARIQELIVS